MVKEGNDTYTSMNEDSELEAHTQAMVFVRKKALSHIKTAQEKQKKYYDAKHNQDKTKYKVGAHVLVKNCKKLSRKGSKLEPNWAGPYTIHEVMGKGTFRK